MLEHILSQTQIEAVIFGLSMFLIVFISIADSRASKAKIKRGGKI